MGGRLCRVKELFSRLIVVAASSAPWRERQRQRGAVENLIVLYWLWFLQEKQGRMADSGAGSEKDKGAASASERPKRDAAKKVRIAQNPTVSAPRTCSLSRGRATLSSRSLASGSGAQAHLPSACGVFTYPRARAHAHIHTLSSQPPCPLWVRGQSAEGKANRMCSL
jgi:hypothetical protein